jgi:uncharacterized membrane protein
VANERGIWSRGGVNSMSDLAIIITAISLFAIVVATAVYGVRKMSEASDRLATSYSALAASVHAMVDTPAPTAADDSAALNAVSDQMDALKGTVDAKVAS